jgi:hypothetical protein
MKIITRPVSRNEYAVSERLRARARAQIAAHHYGCFTTFSPVFTRLLTGLRSRGIVKIDRVAAVSGGK